MQSLLNVLNSELTIENALLPRLQEKLFRVAGVPMVENCMAGYNSCMFCYGQVIFNFFSS